MVALYIIIRTGTGHSDAYPDSLYQLLTDFQS